MLAPLAAAAPLPFAGVIWYQGESNVGRAAQYRTLFPTMIRAWRAAFHDPALPFLFVQLPNFDDPITKAPLGEGGWAELREAQAAALREPKTAMAVTLDMGEGDNLHPRNKREVGRRLALAALQAGVRPRRAGGRADVPDGHARRRRRSACASAGVAGGLQTSDGAPPRGFLIAGADRVWHPAVARIERDVVIVSSPDVREPLAIRYGWGNNPPNTLAQRRRPAGGAVPHRRLAAGYRRDRREASAVRTRRRPRRANGRQRAERATPGRGRSAPTPPVSQLQPPLPERRWWFRRSRRSARTCPPRRRAGCAAVAPLVPLRPRLPRWPRRPAAVRPRPRPPAPCPAVPLVAPPPPPAVPCPPAPPTPVPACRPRGAAEPGRAVPPRRSRWCPRCPSRWCRAVPEPVEPAVPRAGRNRAVPDAVVPAAPAGGPPCPSRRSRRCRSRCVPAVPEPLVPAAPRAARAAAPAAAARAAAASRRRPSTSSRCRWASIRLAMSWNAAP